MGKEERGEGDMGKGDIRVKREIEGERETEQYQKRNKEREIWVREILG